MHSVANISIGPFSRSRSQLVRAAVAVVAATCCLCVSSLAEEVVPAPRMALLVGVQRYPKLDSSRQLAGVRNDISIVRSMLIDRFGFREQDIVTLADNEATADAIRGQWRALAERVGDLPSDADIAHVVFYFSGHGSQILDQPEGDADCDEEDGLDETLVPYDAESEGGDRDLRDDELYQFVASLCGDGRARFWGVLDCCHSGSGARGTTKIRKLDRQLAPSPILTGSRMVRPKVLPPAAVLLTACRASEVEPEYEHGGQSYGLLTRFLVQTLSEHPGASGVSYRALRESVINCYQREAIVPAPTPQLEGAPAALAEAVLGVDENPGQQPWWTVKPMPEDRGTACLSAGELHGVTVGSIYELYERPAAIGAPADQRAAQPLAWLEATKVEPTQATVRVFQWADSRQRRQIDARLPRAFETGYAVKRYYHHGEPGLGFRIVRVQDGGMDGAPVALAESGLPEAVGAALASAEISNGDDLLLRIDGRYAAIFPATGMASVPAAERGSHTGPVPASLRGGWGPIDLASQDAAGQMADCLRRIIRARNLIRLAARQAAERSGPAASLELIAVDLDERLEIAAWRPWTRDNEAAIVLRDGDLFALRAVNTDASTKPWYVTVLAIDPNMEIQAVLPHQDGLGLVDEQRLDPRASRTTSPYRATAPYGTHWAVALATREPNDFSFLAQPAIAQVRGQRGTELEQLLMDYAYPETRSGRRPRGQKCGDDTWSAAVLQWEVTASRR